MCGEYGIDIWNELKAIRKLLEGFQERLVANDEWEIKAQEYICKQGGELEIPTPEPKKKRGRPKGSKNANTQAPKKRDKK